MIFHYRWSWALFFGCLFNQQRKINCFKRIRPSNLVFVTILQIQFPTFIHTTTNKWCKNLCVFVCLFELSKFGRMANNNLNFYLPLVNLWCMVYGFWFTKLFGNFQEVQKKREFIIVWNIFELIISDGSSVGFCAVHVPRCIEYMPLAVIIEIFLFIISCHSRDFRERFLCPPRHVSSPSMI